ncbi:PIN domain-like protein [Mycena galericulata]|nr:PIN domain-like protein [Mycena galericulata]
MCQKLEPALQKRSLQNLTVSEGFERLHKGLRLRALRVGIDASVWLSECPSDMVTSGESPGLERLFYQLCALLRLSVTPIFVFPGPNGPDFKRGKNISKTPHPLTPQLQWLIEAFGFHCHNAPGEADAELAYLNRLELIDIIFTINEEVFIFGATHVMYSPVEDNYQKAYIYTSARINHRAHLSLGGLLLMAILIGGDYDEMGLPGCSEDVACSLARRGLGDSLLFAVQTLGTTELRAFLHVWRSALCRELTRAHGNTSVSAQMPDTFPDPAILGLYVRPVTSWSFTDRPGVDTSDWSPAIPDIVHIARLCENFFPWGTEAELPNKLFRALLPGLCLQRLALRNDGLKLLGDRVLNGRVEEAIPALSSFIAINKFSDGCYRVKISTSSITTAIISSLRGTRQSRPGPQEHTKTIIYVCIPVPILLYGLPGMVDHYERYVSTKGMKCDLTTKLAPVWHFF